MRGIDFLRPAGPTRVFCPTRSARARGELFRIFPGSPALRTQQTRPARPVDLTTGPVPPREISFLVMIININVEKEFIVTIDTNSEVSLPLVEQNR